MCFSFGDWLAQRPLLRWGNYTFALDADKYALAQDN
jgi:hypothetical protein